MGGVQVYMIAYHESVEVARFQMAASREKKAFMNLIRKKAHMVLPVDEVLPPATRTPRLLCSSAYSSNKPETP